MDNVIPDLKKHRKIQLGLRLINLDRNQIALVAFAETLADERTAASRQ